MNTLRVKGYVLGSLGAALLLAVGIALLAYRDIPAPRLEAKYAGPTS